MTPPRSLDLVWMKGLENGAHRQWLRFLLGDRLGKEAVNERFERAEPYTLYAVNSNRLPLSRLPSAFLESAARTPGVGLFDGSDEWYNGDYAAYRSFAFVLRMCHAGRFRNAGVLTAPLGYASGQPVRDTVPPASQRRYLWSFAGQLVGSRSTMMRALDGLEPATTHIAAVGQDLSEGRLSKSEYHDLLADSVFVPCPMGNVMLESYRIYEALENGAVPILERRRWRPYFEELFGRHPLPAFRTWTEARSFMARAQTDPAGLDALQCEVGTWWADEKAAWRRRVDGFLDRGLGDALRDELATLPVREQRWRRRLDQTLELARHHSPAAARQRLFTILRRLLTTGHVASARRRHAAAQFQGRHPTPARGDGDRR
jgi:hypothetical protein